MEWYLIFTMIGTIMISVSGLIRIIYTPERIDGLSNAMKIISQDLEFRRKEVRESEEYQPKLEEIIKNGEKTKIEIKNKYLMARKYRNKWSPKIFAIGIIFYILTLFAIIIN